jgi:hypothetical protein
MNSNFIESDLNLIKSKFNWIQFFKNGMQIDAQVIENMLITFIIHNYDVEKEKEKTLEKTQI